MMQQSTSIPVLSIYGWTRSQALWENITYKTSSLTGYDRAQFQLANP